MNSIPMEAAGYAQRIDSLFFDVVRRFDAIKETMKAYEKTLDGKPTMIVRRRAEQLRQQTMSLALRMETLHLRASAKSADKK